MDISFCVGISNSDKESNKTYEILNGCSADSTRLSCTIMSCMFSIRTIRMVMKLYKVLSDNDEIKL